MEQAISTSAVEPEPGWFTVPETSYKHDVSNPESEGDFPYVAFGDIAYERKAIPAIATDLYRYKVIGNSNAIALHIEQLFDIFPFNERWLADGIKMPTLQCKKNMVSIATQIYEQFGLLPVQVAPSVEEGVMLVYWNKSKTRNLKIEVYNTLEIAGVISANSKIINCLDIEYNWDLINLIVKFVEK